MVWWPFAPQPERADTSEVTDLHSGAPPLYSTSFVVRVYLFPVVPVKKHSVGCLRDYLYNSLMNPDFSNSATNELSMNCSGLAVLPAGLTE